MEYATSIKENSGIKMEVNTVLHVTDSWLLVDYIVHAVISGLDWVEGLVSVSIEKRVS